MKRAALNLAGSTIKLAERLLRGTRFNPDRVKGVLILEYMLPLGCCVHLTPLYESIKRARPDVTITVATRGLGVALLRHHRFIDNLIETPDPLTDIRSAARVLRAELSRRGIHPDCTLTGLSDQRSRIALLALMTGGGLRAGFTQAPGLYHCALERDSGLSQIDNNLRLASLLGCGDGHVEPCVFFFSADVAAMTDAVKQANPENKPLVVMVTQNSGGQRTGWHNERFVQVIRYAHDVMGCAVAYVGTAADTAVIEQLRCEANGIGTSLAGKTSVTELAALLAMSDAVVSLDTGTMHVGRAVQTPLVVIAPSWQKPLEWLPLDLPNARILRGPDRDDVPPNYRLDEVEAQAVIDALEDLLRAFPARAESRAQRIQAGLSNIDHRSK